MSLNCPYCSRPMPSIGLTVDLSTNNAYFDGEAVKLRPSGAEILHVLLRYVGKAVPQSELSAAIYGAEGATDNTLAVHISWLRKALEPRGWSLRCFWGRGYVLARHDAMAAGSVALRQRMRAS